MITFRNISKYFLLCALILSVNGQILFAADDSMHHFGGYPHYGMGGFNNAGRQRSKRLEAVGSHLRDLHQRRDALERSRDQWVGREVQYAERLEKLTADIDEYEVRFNEGSKDADSIIGTAWARGLAGKDAWSMLDLEAEKPGIGITAGLSHRFATLLGKKIEDTFDAEGSEAWRTVIGGSLRSIADVILNIWYKLFHGGYRPLNLTDLSDWSVAVDQIILFELNKNAKDSVVQANSNKGARMGSFLEMGAEGEELPSPEEFAQQQEDRVWRLKMQGYAQDLTDLIANLEYHKPYYLAGAKGANTQTNIVRHIVRLQDDLCLLRDEILLPTRSLKELAAGDTKIFLQQISKDLKKRFELLGAIVGRYHGGAGHDKNASTPATSPARPGGYGGYGGYGAGVS